MLQHESPGDYIVATSESHSVREFVQAAFARAGIDYRKYVEIDPRYFRPSEVEYLLGDASKAYRELGWKPTVRFDELVAMMTDHDMELARHEKLLLEHRRPGQPARVFAA
jgi:GDPmannose 4,6-dehydratase